MAMNTPAVDAAPLIPLDNELKSSPHLERVSDALSACWDGDRVWASLLAESAALGDCLHFVFDAPVPDGLGYVPGDEPEASIAYQNLVAQVRAQDVSRDDVMAYAGWVERARVAAVVAGLVR